MSLLFFKNNKQDNRMVEYDQAVVRLGLEKARVWAELDRARAEVAETGERKATLLNEIVGAEKKLQTIRQEIIDIINTGKEEINKLSRTQQETGETTNEKTKKLVQLEEYIVSLNSKANIQQETLYFIEDKVRKEREVLGEAKSELNSVLAEKHTIEADIISLQELKTDLKESVALAEKTLEYLAEKEQFLNRKEADLIKYEKRVEKMREDTGNKNTMKFK